MKEGVGNERNGGTRLFLVEKHLDDENVRVGSNGGIAGCTP